MMFGELIVILSIMVLCFLMGQVIGYSQGAKQIHELYKGMK